MFLAHLVSIHFENNRIDIAVIFSAACTGTILIVLFIHKYKIQKRQIMYALVDMLYTSFYEKILLIDHNINVVIWWLKSAIYIYSQM